MALIGSSINGPVETASVDNFSVGFALLIGFFICCFSLVSGLTLAYFDAWAAKKDNVKFEISENERFHLSDLKQINSLPYWLAAFSLMANTNVIFVYVEFSSDMLRSRFGFGDSAGTFFALPYIIACFVSPLAGIVIDKNGKNPLFSK